MSDKNNEGRSGWLMSIAGQLNALRDRWSPSPPLQQPITPKIVGPLTGFSPPQPVSDSSPSITNQEARAVVGDFWTTYKAARDITYVLGWSEQEAFGYHAEQGKRTFGMYVPMPDGDNYVCIALNNAPNKESLYETLNHEVLGHWALNTFTPPQKQALLERIIEARQQPALSAIWQTVDSAYHGLPDIRKAEEVYSILAESCDPKETPPLEDSQKVWQSVVVEQSRVLTIRDLLKIQSTVASQIRDGQRVQKTFPPQNFQSIASSQVVESSRPAASAERESMQDRIDARYEALQAKRAQHATTNKGTRTLGR